MVVGLKCASNSPKMRGKTVFPITSLVLLWLVLGTIQAESCTARWYGDKAGSFVCVCNASHCDSFEEIKPSGAGVITVVQTDRTKLRFAHSTLHFTNATGTPTTGQVVWIDRQTTYQTVLGFGAAFTDATGFNLLKLSSNLGKNIIKDYFGHDGLRYSMGRVPIGGSDFSTHPYTYDDANKDDYNLTNFKLAPEDFKYKIPIIELAKNVSVYPLKLFASPWSPPAWMKTNGALNGKGSIKGTPDGSYYSAWAKYLVKFLDSYKANNIKFWGMTIQNEPYDGTLNNFSFNCNGMTPEEQRDFIVKTLVPALKSAGYGKDTLKLMIVDDQRPFIGKWCDTILSDPKASELVAGIAFHWYLNMLTSPDILDEMHRKYPSHFLLSSEACEGSSPLDSEKVSLGNWQRAENYAYDIIQDLQHHTSGWIDWNMALDMQGGPNWVHNFVDSPIIVNGEVDEYYKQPMYYALAHFSRFIEPGSWRLGIKSSKDALQVTVFANKQGATVAVVLNRFQSTIPLQIVDSKHGTLNTSVPGHSILTFIWNDS